MNIALLDFRQAIRNMRKNLGSTLLAVLMLAVGIGATSAIFSVFYSVLIEPLPFPEPSRLVTALGIACEATSGTRLPSLKPTSGTSRQRNRTFKALPPFMRSRRT